MPASNESPLTSGFTAASQLERTLGSRGVDVFGYERRGNVAIVRFAKADVEYRVMLTLPAVSDFSRTPTGQTRAVRAMRNEYEAEVRVRWNALLGLVRAKLDAVEVGVTSWDDEFEHLRAPVAELTAGVS